MRQSRFYGKNGLRFASYLTEYEKYDIKIPEGKITLPEKFSQNIKTKENQTDESSLLTSEKTNKNEIELPVVPVN